MDNDENIFAKFNILTETKNNFLEERIREAMEEEIFCVPKKQNEKIFKVIKENEIGLYKESSIIELENFIEWDNFQTSYTFPKLRIDQKTNSNRRNFRVDDAKKHFKVAINNFALDKLNYLIKNSLLSKKLKKKIHSPNFKKFTSNVKELDNYEFLSYQLKDILVIGQKDNNLQSKNLFNIEKIFDYKKCPEETKKIKDFLNKNYEEIIKLFYESEMFQKFKNNELTKFFNNGIEKEKKLSLLEDYGLIKLFKMTSKKRKEEKILLDKDIIDEIC